MLGAAVAAAENWLLPATGGELQGGWLWAQLGQLQHSCLCRPLTISCGAIAGGRIRREEAALLQQQL